MRTAKIDLDFNGTNPETENVIPTQISDLTDGQQTLNAISQNAQDIDTIENTLPNLASQNYVDQKFNGAAKAISFDSYATMITAFNALDDDVYVSGQNINILTLEVPDLWVYEVDSTRIPYTYVDDATFTNELSTNGYVQVGYYKLAALETQKVDLTDYQEKLTTTNVPSGTIDENIGFDNLGNVVRSAGGSQSLYLIYCKNSYCDFYILSQENLTTFAQIADYLYNKNYTSSTNYLKVIFNNKTKRYGSNTSQLISTNYKGIYVSGNKLRIYLTGENANLIGLNLSIDFTNETYSLDFNTGSLSSSDFVQAATLDISSEKIL